MPSFSAAIPPGGSYVIEDGVDSALKLAVNGDRQPFTVDIESKRRGVPSDSYERILPLQRYGVRNVRVTREKVFETREIDDEAVVRITFTNASGDEMTVSGFYNSNGVDEYFAEDTHSYEDARYFGSVAVVTRESDERLFETANRLLKDVGEGGTVWVEPANYTKANEGAVEGTLRSQHPDQRINFFDSTIEAADGESGTMVDISHGGFKLVNVDLSGNRENTTVDTCITTAPGLSNVRVDEVEVSGAPTGLEVNSPEDSILTNIRSAESNANVDTPVHIKGGANVELTNAVIPLYGEQAVLVENASGVVASNMVLGGCESGTATAGLHTRGVDSSRFSGIVVADGDVADGILDEAYDPGGADEKVSTGNRFQFDVNGARDRGLHVSDAEVERLDVNVNGEYSGGRTTQGFEFDHPEDIAVSPAHQADVDVRACTRWTDTSIPSADAGATVSGHVTDISETCDYQLNGRSVTAVTFGVDLPQPVANVGTDTGVEFRQPAQSDTTDADGQVSISWADYYHFVDKPLLSVYFEDTRRAWYVDSWATDAGGRYTGATIQVTNQAGSDIGSGVSVNLDLAGV